MSLFLPNIPQPNDNLDFSQGQLLSNNQGLDTVFGVDHYKFSDATVNKGFHSYIHTPQQAAHPTTTATVPQMYAMQDSANVGVLDYSRGWTISAAAPAVPTPITCLQSKATATVVPANTPVTVLDFTGLTLAIATLYVYDTVIGMSAAEVRWSGAVLTIDIYVTQVGIVPQVTGSILQINTGTGLNNLYWTLRFHRMQ